MTTASSRRFQKLQSRIRELRKHFLPKEFDPTGSYSERQFDRVSAFRLLAHAEIESYLEEIVFETASKIYDDWQNSGVVTESLLALVAYADRHLGKVPESRPTESVRDLEQRIKKSRELFNAYVNDKNHGIKESHVLKLLLPVGISEFDIDQTWLSTTNSFGDSRGTTAHKSKPVDTKLDPRNEFDIVNQILAGLSEIDSKLLEFRSI